jgi:aspartate/methionine/tyrosine aminotransferase
MPFKTPPPLQTHINKCSSRLDKVAPFLAMDVMAQAKVRTLNGESIVHMEVGEPSASTPLGIKQAAIDALNHGNVGYTQALGLPALRARIAQHYADQYRITIPMERVVVTTGSSAGFVLSFLTLFNAGDRVAIACPGYPAYRNILSALDLEPVLIPSGADEGWIMSAQAIMAAHNQKPLHGVLVMSPANPTGKMMSAHELSGLTSTCQNLGLPLISDEIYHGLTFESEATTALHANDQAIIINSFSKYYAMTGWRIGWMIVPHI